MALFSQDYISRLRTAVVNLWSGIAARRRDNGAEPVASPAPNAAKGANRSMLRVFATLFAGLVVLGLGAALAGFYML
ncbi:MAG TPA: hypothetical protein DD437_13415, partial [Rhodobiaceae bacterium]|nr:hypothetical protein [Rhodobiaceae bacterium]